MKKFAAVFAGLVILSAVGAENLLKTDFKQLDASGKNAGFQIFRAEIKENSGSKSVVLDIAKKHFVTIPVVIESAGSYTFSGRCSGDADSIYAKLSVNGKIITASCRQKYMKKSGSGDMIFDLNLSGVPAGNGYLFISARGSSGTIELKNVELTFKKKTIQTENK